MRDFRCEVAVNELFGDSSVRVASFLQARSPAPDDRAARRELLLCLAEGIGIIPWSPLARGFLTGNRSKEDFGETTRAKTDDFAKNMYYQDEDFTVVDRVVELAGKKGVSAAQIATAWILNKPGITAPIIGASKMFQLEEAVAAAEIELSADEVKYLEEPYVPHKVLGH